ncbi:penicillin-binding protein 1B [Saccharophagus sp. K07]|nr:penicillin-binding protein 1B [Saccharophagus sp. K07]
MASRKKKAVKRKSFPIFKLFFLMLLAGAAALAVYCIHLDKVVRSQFEGKRFALPARVYARPLELFEGKHLALADLRRELDMLGFAKVNQVRAAGEYFVAPDHVILQTRPFEFWDGAQGSHKIRVTFDGGIVESIRDESNGRFFDLFRLEPIAIGGIYTSNREDRQLVRYNQVPRHFIDMLIAIEDKRFYYHHGVDPKALMRAAVSTLTGRGVQGGSTITQQLVKNFFLTPERTFKRKANEMLMAILLELRYDKHDILETYLNEVYFGQDGTRAIHGIGLASQFYFGRTVDQMKPHHSALLVAMLKGPTYYNPRRNPKRALERRNLVLAETGTQGYITPQEFEQALAQPLDVTRSGSMGLSNYPAFLDLVFRQLRRDYQEDDLRNEGLRIFSTLDPLVQSAAERTLAQQLTQLEQRNKLAEGWLEGAAVISVPQTGEVLAVIGGRASGFEGFNRALDAKRPIGSLFKPAIFLTALERPEYSLATLLDDSPLQWQEPGMKTVWEPQNYDKLFHGQVPLWQSLANSYNVSTARLGLELGVKPVLQTAQRLGIEDPLPPYAATFLGAAELPPIQVAQMYQTIAAGGFRVPLRAIREVLTTEGRPLKRYSIEVQQVASPQSVHLLTRALQLAVEEGTAKSMKSILPESLHLAGKTGTTDGLRDSWFAGFSGDYVAVVWVGNDKNQPTGLTGATGALPIWARTMAQLNPAPVRQAEPDGITYVASHRVAGGRVRGSCHNAVVLPFVEGTVPQMEVGCDGSTSYSVGDKAKKWWQRILR